MQNVLFEMDSMSDFLVLAATLLEIKSKLLLPQPEKDEPEEDPREELINRLIEYKRFKEAAQALQGSASFGLIFKKINSGVSELQVARQQPGVEDVLANVPMDALIAAFREALNRRELKTDKIRSGFNAVRKDPYTVDEKIAEIRGLLARHRTVSFLRIMERAADKSEMVTTFLAVLELVKIREIEAKQEHIFSDIEIRHL